MKEFLFNRLFCGHRFFTDQIKAVEKFSLLFDSTVLHYQPISPFDIKRQPTKFFNPQQADVSGNTQPRMDVVKVCD